MKMTQGQTVLFSKNDCVNCDATKADLDSLGVQYSVINISEQPEYVAKLKALGFRSAPVVVAPTGSWAGYNPEKIQAAFAA
jgi:glutaredoxin-like protein NrdH